jgi:hypothetical protein
LIYGIYRISMAGWSSSQWEFSWNFFVSTLVQVVTSGRRFTGLRLIDRRGRISAASHDPLCLAYGHVIARDHSVHQPWLPTLGSSQIIFDGLWCNFGFLPEPK